ncbi:MAG: hypothetical protein F7B61_01705 [Caldisphaeraceae archaeon]|nr:hypothetical protein [Caldisphaeraceae archaeon]
MVNRYSTKGPEDLVDETMKRITWGLYIMLNSASYAKYKKPFKTLFFNSPLDAFNLIKDSSSSNSARALFKVLARALGFEQPKIDYLVESLERGDDSKFREELEKVYKVKRK